MRARDYEKRLQGLVINSPIEQNTFGKGGIYECLHIPKKSMSFNEFRSKAKELDKITDGKTADEVEDIVILILYSFGRMLPSQHHYMGQIYSAH